VAVMGSPRLSGCPWWPTRHAGIPEVGAGGGKGLLVGGRRFRDGMAAAIGRLADDPPGLAEQLGLRTGRARCFSQFTREPSNIGSSMDLIERVPLLTAPPPPSGGAPKVSPLSTRLPGDVAQARICC